MITKQVRRVFAMVFPPASAFFVVSESFIQKKWSFRGIQVKVLADLLPEGLIYLQFAVSTSYQPFGSFSKLETLPRKNCFKISFSHQMRNVGMVSLGSS